MRTRRGTPWLAALACGALLCSAAAAAEPAAGQTHAAAAAHPQPHGSGHQPSIWEGGIGNSIVTLIIFGGVVWILGRYAWGPLMRVLQEREQTIRTQLEEARRERREAQALLTRYQEQLDQARQQATAIVEEGRRDAEAVRQRIHEQARREADEMIARARREIQLATDAAKREVYDLAAELAIDVARRVIQRELTPQDHRELVRQSIEAMSAAGGRMN